jgi:hypothetical protein
MNHGVEKLHKRDVSEIKERIMMRMTVCYVGHVVISSRMNSVVELWPFFLFVGLTSYHQQYICASLPLSVVHVSSLAISIHLSHLHK